MSKDTEATFVRRKFTNTEELDKELERMAVNNYQGNVSLCLRQAITDHRETLRGNGDLTLRRLVESVAHIEGQISDLEESIHALTEQTTPSNIDHPQEAVVSVDDEPIVASSANQIVATLEEANTPLRVADIIERVDMQPVDVRYMLGYLVDQGYVFTTREDTPRYQLATMGCNPTDRDRFGV